MKTTTFIRYLFKLNGELCLRARALAQASAWETVRKKERNKFNAHHVGSNGIFLSLLRFLRFPYFVSGSAAIVVSASQSESLPIE